MQLEQGFDLPFPPATAWPAFENIELLVQCLPGAALTGPAVDGELPIRLDVKLGPIAAAFVGSGRVSQDRATQGGRFEGTATDRRSQSRVKGFADFKLAAEGDGTRVSLLVDYSLTGTLAQFSRGAIVRELASALTAQFAANLSQRVQATATPAPADAPAAPVAIAPPPTGATATAIPPAEAPSALTATATACAAAPTATAATATPPTGASTPHAATATAPLNAGALLVLVLKSAWQRLLGRLRGRNA